MSQGFPVFGLVKLRMYLRYINYVLRHKWWVFYAGIRLGVTPWGDPVLFWRLLKHDWTKFLPGEMVAYANNFSRPWPHGKPEEVKEAFDRAWNLHQKRNDHHWQYWLLTLDNGEEIALEPSINALVEMVCDWAGAGRAITGKWDLSSWYQANRERIHLHPTSYPRAERLIELLAEEGLQ